ncbi:MAG: alanine racemase [Clostridiales bacterium]|nr:alanine racemase [Clostridiales bacterium]
MKSLVFDTAALKHNLEVVRTRAGDARIFAVLTGDGYGAGLVELARVLRENGIDSFAIGDPEDARRLRDAGFGEEQILMLNASADTEVLKQLIDLNVICTIGSYETGVALNAAAEELGTYAEAHVLIDTGIGYCGFLPSEPEKLLQIFQHLPRVTISGTYTRLISDSKDISHQMELFQEALNTLRQQGLDPGLIHASNSAALMQTDNIQFGAVRVGSALLGLTEKHRGRGRSALKQVCHGEATLDVVRWLPKGSSLGYEQQVTLRRATRVAILQVGYQNGFGTERVCTNCFRAFFQALRSRRRRYVTIDGKRARILGRIGPTETAIDVTDLKCSEASVARFQIDPRFARGLHRVYR